MNKKLSPAIAAVLWGGLLGGTIDVFTAALIYLTSPIVILQAIASGLLGRAAFSGGAGVAVLGLFLQWGMSLIIASIYVFAASLIGLVRRNWLAGGVAAGIVIYFVMNDVVRPLSAAWPPNPWSAPVDWAKFAENMLAMILYGLMLAFFTRRYASKSAPA